MQAVIQNFLHASRVEDRHHPVDEDKLRLVRIGRAFGGMIIAHQADDAAMLRRASHVGMAEDIARAVNARPLAIPEAEDAIIFAFATHFGLLRAPDGGRGKVLVQTGLEQHLSLIQLALGAKQLRVEPAQRRAAIAGDKACRVQPSLLIAQTLRHQQAHDGLGACQKHMALGQIILVIQRDGPQRRQAPTTWRRDRWSNWIGARYV